MIALAGGTAAAVLLLSGLIMTATSALATSPLQADVVPTFYVAAAITAAIEGGVLSVFVFAVSKVIPHTGMLGRWLGWLGFLVGQQRSWSRSDQTRGTDERQAGMGATEGAN